MNHKAITIAAFIALAASIPSCRIGDETMPRMFVVTASELACRKSPAVSAPIIRFFPFGYPLLVTERSVEKTRIDGVEARWYREKQTGGWVFGGYLMDAGAGGPTGTFDSQRIRCNVICGGLSCFYDFTAIIAGDCYVAEVFLEDYPMEKGVPATGLAVGKCTVGKDRVSFGNALKIVGYDMAGSYLPNVERLAFSSKDWIMNRFAQTYEKRSDPEGEYYLASGSRPMPPRKVLRDKCASKSGGEEIWLDIKVFTKAPLSEIQKAFPLVKARR